MRVNSRYRHRFISLFLLLLVVTSPLAAQNLAPGASREFGDRTQEVTSRKSLRDFPRDLADNALGLFSRDNVLPLVVGMGAAAALHPLDARVRDQFDRPGLGIAGNIFGSKLGNGATVAAAVGSVWAVSRIRGRSDKFSQFSYDLAQATTLNTLLTAGLKQAVNRKRPSGAPFSFPSGHTSSAFAAATVIDHHYGWKTSVFGYAAATFIGVSRIDSRKHHLSDVVAGATVGYIVGRTVTRRSSERQRFKWNPIVSASSKTVGVQMYWEWDK